MTTLSPDMLRSILQELQVVNTAFNQKFPGDSPARQPIHTVYGGGQLFKSDSIQKLGMFALNALKEYASTPAQLAAALELDESAKDQKVLYRRIVEKLQREPVEDFRIDFEDGYGNRPDAEEDMHASMVAGELVRGMNERTLPPFIGIRIKPLNEELKDRSIRTLDIVLSTVLEKSGGRLPENFVVTLPKITVTEQVDALVKILSMMESRHGLSRDSLKFEIMIETPQSILNPRGECALPALIAAGDGRCIAAHFGVYDYTASMNITAAHQSMDHPACDFARHIMKVALAGTGVWISDGATNVMPVGPHRPQKGKPLSAKQKRENKDVVYRAWRLGFAHTMHSLRNGYYQGWDLHPAQLPVRYAAVYSFFRAGLDAASIRLRAFMDKAAQATLVGEVFDDAATGQGLLNYFLSGLSCGAITEDEATATGLTVDEIRSRSFLKILQGRRVQ